MIDFDEPKNCNQCINKCMLQFINDEDVKYLNGNKSDIYYTSGQVITKQSSFASKIVFISSGLVKVIKEGKDGKNTIIKLVGENSFLTVPIHENQKKSSFTAIALTNSEICEINESGLHNLISNNQKFGDFMLDNYFNDQLFLMNRIHLLNTRNNHGKLASSLLYLDTFNKPDLSVFDFITRKDLAEISLISLESVNKILQELKNDMIIDITSKGIQIKSLKLIEKLSNIG